ncbi:hypothetical protein HRH25_15805 [Flavisolibacter sp. BT320]|nr:hypothetical protein [Flavisolibacter longurius]
MHRSPAANNHNAGATVNNRSCEYNPTYYTPEIKLNPLCSTLNETSALQMPGGSLWTLNDGCGAAAIYRIDTTAGTGNERYAFGFCQQMANC